MNKNGITVLSLFDGMSCARIALKELGIKVDKYYASEIDKHQVREGDEGHVKAQKSGRLIA